MIIDGVHRARAAVQLGIGEINAQIIASGDRLIETRKIAVDSLHSSKQFIDLSGKGTYRWFRALEEVAAGTHGPILVIQRPGGIPIHDVKLLRSRN